jgi:DNA-binding LacI/PurR family transcriptional regulator
MQQSLQTSRLERTIKGQWTEESAHQAVNAWLRLPTSHELSMAAVIAQNDSMAAYARRAFSGRSNWGSTGKLDKLAVHWLRWRVH